MNRKDFDWDGYLAQASYREIVDLSPALSHDMPPTMYSPDRSLLYLSSQDLGVVTNDVSQLQQLLRLVLETYRHSQKPGFEKKRLAAITDCCEICRLLVQCGVDSEEYQNPDLLLNSEDVF